MNTISNNNYASEAYKANSSNPCLISNFEEQTQVNYPPVRAGKTKAIHKTEIIKLIGVEKSLCHCPTFNLKRRMYFAISQYQNAMRQGAF